MNLTLSLAINGGGTGTTKKRKLLRDSVVVVDDVMSCDGGDHSRVVRLLQARERMMARLDADDDPRAAAAAARDDDSGGLRLMHLLLSSVAAAESGDAHAAAAALHEVYRRASSRGGDPAQRVAAYFADALASSRLVRSSSRVAAEASPVPTRAERFLAYTMFYQASPIYQLAHFTANQAIVEAFESGGRRRLHVVDFDVSYGFQWPSLIQSLSHAAAAASTSTTTSSSSHDDGDGDGDCAAGTVSLRITGFGTSPDELRQTEARLARFASGCPNLRFEFEGIVDDGGPDSGHRHERIKVDDDATLVVNLVFPAAQSSMATSTREEACSALARIRSLNPSLVFLVEKDGGGGGGGGNATSRGRSTSVLPPFTASLRYFAAVFDSLHECLPADSAERLAIERNHLGVEISDAMASLDDYNNGGGDDHHVAAEPSSWKQMMERAGFERVELSSRTVSQAKLLLKMKSGGCGGFRVVMEGEGGRAMAMSLGWRDRAQLITATGWRRRRRSINKQASLFS